MQEDLTVSLGTHATYMRNHPISATAGRRPKVHPKDEFYQTASQKLSTGTSASVPINIKAQRVLNRVCLRLKLQVQYLWQRFSAVADLPLKDWPHTGTEVSFLWCV